MGGLLDTAYAAVENPSAASGINGEFHASYLDYETTAIAGGLITSDPSAIFDATDSTFHGSSIGGGDYITSYASALVHVAYSTIADAHCAFHFDDVAHFEIDCCSSSHSGRGLARDVRDDRSPRRLRRHALRLWRRAERHQQLELHWRRVRPRSGRTFLNGALTITNTFTKGPNTTLPTTTWLPADVAAAPIADAKPR